MLAIRSSMDGARARLMRLKFNLGGVSLSNGKLRGRYRENDHLMDSSKIPGWR